MPGSKRKAEQNWRSGVLDTENHNQPQISLRKRENTADKSSSSEAVLICNQYHSCLVWVYLHSLGCCENLAHQEIETTFSSSWSWKTEIQNGVIRLNYSLLSFWQDWGHQKALGNNISLICPTLKTTHNPQLADLFLLLQTQQHLQSLAPMTCSLVLCSAHLLHKVDVFVMKLSLPGIFQLPPEFKIIW